MKKNFLFAVMAFFMGLIVTSCSQDEIISSKDQTGGGAISIDVNIPVNNPVTRAVPNIPQGYTLRCILQLMKSDGSAAIGDKIVQEVPAGTEKITFTFNAPSEEYKCAFWADYVKPAEGQDLAAADNIYNTADLKAIGYTANAGNEMFNGDVADAFYACSLEPVTGNGALASITLKRPFTKITFKDGQSAYTDYTKITIKDLPAPTGFNVMSGETAGYAGKGDYTNSKISSSELAVENGKWFSAYLFASSNKENLGTGNDIVFELKKTDNTSSGELKLNGASITLTENVEVEATVEPKKDGDTSIDVIFPDGMVDPNTLAVGDYILKDGTFSKTYSDQAVAIVWKLVTDGGEAVGDAANNYTAEANGTDMTGKKITGYAFSITCPARAGIKGTETLPSLTGTKAADQIFGDNVYGITQSNSFIKQFENYSSPVLSGFNTWKSDNSLSSTNNVSSWYIPTAAQTRDMVGIVLNGDKVDYANRGAGSYSFAKQIAAVYTAWTSARGENKFQNHTSTSNLLTSGSIIKDDTQNLAIIQVAEDAQITVGTEEVIGNSIGLRAAAITNSYSIRPVLTIFEGISKAQ